MPKTKYTRIEVVSGPDAMGRYVHFRYWLADYHPGHPDGENRSSRAGADISRRPAQARGNADPGGRMSATSSLTKGEKRKLQAAGCAARAAGQPVSACPERTFSEQEHHWQLGWWRHYYATTPQPDPDPDREVGESHVLRTDKHL